MSEQPGRPWIGWCDFHDAGGDLGLDCWGAGINGQDSCTLEPMLLLSHEEAMRYAYDHADWEAADGAYYAALNEARSYKIANRRALAAALGIDDG